MILVFLYIHFVEIKKLKNLNGMKTKVKISFWQRCQNFWWLSLMFALLSFGAAFFLKISLLFLFCFCFLLITAVLLYKKLSIPILVVTDDTLTPESKRITEEVFNLLKGKKIPLGDNDYLMQLISEDLLKIIDGKFGFSLINDSLPKENCLVEVVEILGYYPEIHISLKMVEGWIQKISGRIYSFRFFVMLFCKYHWHIFLVMYYYCNNKK